MFDVIIIGSGPAGLSAAIYGARAGLNQLVLEMSPMSGGQIMQTYEVDNYPGLPEIAGFDMATKFREHADKLGVHFMTAMVTKIEDLGEKKAVITDIGTYEAQNIILATGANHATLGVDGEEQLLGCGVSYCATCDGAFFKRRTVAVIGGGDVAVEDAIFLARLCEKVYVIHRRDKLRAQKVLQEQLFAFPNVEMIWDSEVLSINGEDQVESLTVLNKKLQEKTQLSVSGVFVAVGIIPNTSLVKDLVELDEASYVKADETGKTSCRGIFVAGDARKKALRQVVTAVADGANAITSVQENLTLMR